MIKIGGKYPIVDAEATLAFRMGEIVEVVNWARNWNMNEMVVARTCDGQEHLCWVTRLGPEVSRCPMS